jgi:hypothetical protein
MSFPFNVQLAVTLQGLLNSYHLGRGDVSHVVDAAAVLAHSIWKEYENLGGDEPGQEDCDHPTWCGFCRAREASMPRFLAPKV